MKILIINISLRPESKALFFPLGLAYIATAIKNHGYNVDILDIDANRYTEEYIARHLRDNKYDVVCMGCIVTGYAYVKRLARLIKEVDPRANIIVGNSVASSVPDILLTKTGADIAVIGEGDVTIAEVLDALRLSRDLKDVRGICYKDNGEVRKNPPQRPIEDIDTIPFPDWELFDMEKYIDRCTEYGLTAPLPAPRDKIRAFTISTARGCPFQCTFCYHVFKGVKYRHISPKVLVKEMKRLKEKYGINYFKFHDDLSLVSKRHAKEMIECLSREDLDVFWVADCRPDLFDSESDIELARQLKASGCVGLVFGLESASPKILKMMNRRHAPEAFSTHCRILDKAGLSKWVSVLFGYPEETPDTIKETFDCCLQNEIYPSAGYLLPFPGSIIYDYALKNGFVRHGEEYLLKLGDRQDLRINMTSMTDDELQRNIVEGLAQCNEKLKIGLKREQLIKTQHYRAKETVK
jgi:radical SAM superfamily enzyme YgiQ (UPF0313 family)